MKYDAICSPTHFVFDYSYYYIINYNTYSYFSMLYVLHVQVYLGRREFLHKTSAMQCCTVYVHLYNTCPAMLSIVLMF